jgi:hypothetical protein
MKTSKLFMKILKWKIALNTILKVKLIKEEFFILIKETLKYQNNKNHKNLNNNRIIFQIIILFKLFKHLLKMKSLILSTKKIIK